MDSLFDVLDSQTVVTIAAIALSVLLFKLLLRILNVGSVILTAIAIVLVLHFGFDISPRQVWYEISHLFHNTIRLMTR